MQQHRFLKPDHARCVAIMQCFRDLCIRLLIVIQRTRQSLRLDTHTLSVLARLGLDSIDPMIAPSHQRQIFMEDLPVQPEPRQLPAYSSERVPTIRPSTSDIELPPISNPPEPNLLHDQNQTRQYLTQQSYPSDRPYERNIHLDQAVALGSQDSNNDILGHQEILTDYNSGGLNLTGQPEDIFTGHLF